MEPACGQIFNMINVLAGLTHEEIHTQALLFVLAGYETTATSLTLITYSLATNPECQDKVIQEIDSVLNGHVSTFLYHLYNI